MPRRYDLVILGMGSAGMSAAEFAATLGLRVAAIERGRVGGDCLWTGCVPSKALLASAKVAHHLRHADRWGLPASDAEIDTALVWKRLRAVQHEIAGTDDDPERFRSLGVEVVPGRARLTGPRTVDVDGRVLHTRFVLVCTGSRPVAPPIPGLADAGFLTSENVFELEEAPRSLVAIGGGPISLELAQAFTRLGTHVRVLELFPRVLPRDDPGLVDLLVERLRAEGVDLRLEVQIERVEVAGGEKVVHCTEQGEARRWAADELLVGAGRAPNVEGLGLEELGVRIGRRGVEVDGRMRTAVPSIYAVGDVAGRYLFTHSAGYEAVRAVRDMFLPGRGVADADVPWCTFTDPELAHAGMTEREAREAHGSDVQVLRAALSHSDRARADGTPEGQLVVVCGPGGRLLGGHILAPSAGEMIHELALAIHAKMRLRDLAGFIHVYPTLSTSVAQLAAHATYDAVRRYRWLATLRRRLPL